LEDIVNYPNWGSSKVQPQRTQQRLANPTVSESSSEDGSVMILSAENKKSPFSQRHIIQMESEQRDLMDKTAQTFDRPRAHDSTAAMEEGPREPVPNPKLEVGPVPKTPSPQQRLAEKVREKTLGKRQPLILKLNPAPEPPYRGQTPAGTGSLIDMGPNATEKTVNAASREVLSDPNLNPIVLIEWCNAHWGEEWMEWEPETILEMADREDISIDQVNLGKMFAARAVVKTEEFFREPRVFEKVCIAFSDRIVDFGVIQIPRVHDMAAAVALVEGFIREGSYSDHVAAYVAAAAITDGFLLLPPNLQFAGYHFSLELASRVGDDAFALQERMIKTMNDDQSPTTEDEAIQYRRLMRSEYHVREMTNGAKHK
jgi:hypothetical protein